MAAPNYYGMLSDCSMNLLTCLDSESTPPRFCGEAFNQNLLDYGKNTSNANQRQWRETAFRGRFTDSVVARNREDVFRKVVIVAIP